MEHDTTTIVTAIAKAACAAASPLAGVSPTVAVLLLVFFFGAEPAEKWCRVVDRRTRGSELLGALDRQGDGRGE